ncbi:MAG TPA: hypothetical protein VE035_15035 [Puia sp.]|nr:hypothetical protein [Puia sp.]
MKVLLFLFFPLIGFSQPKLEKISLLDNKVEILSPKQLSPMSDQIWVTKYPAWATKYGEKNRPALALSDANGEVNFLAEMTGMPAAENQLGDFKKFQMQGVAKYKGDVEFLGNGVKTINGKQVGYFKFLSKAADQKVFNYYFFCTVGGKILSFTFNCIESLQKDWEKTADEMMASLKVK